LQSGSPPEGGVSSTGVNFSTLGIVENEDDDEDEDEVGW
jgi:hypothetical protein